MRLPGIIFLAATSFAHGQSLELVATIPMPSVKGRIDHFAVDAKGQRLFVAALGNDTVEVLDIARNRHEKSLAGFGEPQGLLYLQETQQLYVGNGSSNRLDVLDGRSFKRALRMDKLDDADNLRYDPAAGSVIVGYGTGALRIVDARSGASKGDIALAGHPEAFQVERGGTRIFVNVPTFRQVAVVDRAKGNVVATWPVSARQNFPMALAHPLDGGFDRSLRHSKLHTDLGVRRRTGFPRLKIFQQGEEWAPATFHVFILQSIQCGLENSLRPASLENLVGRQIVHRLDQIRPGLTDGLQRKQYFSPATFLRPRSAALLR